MTVPLAKTQDPGEVLIWTYDWAEEFAANGSPTITSAAVTADTAGAVISPGDTHDDTTVTFELACPTVPLGTVVGVTAEVVLSSAERERRTHYITITKT